MVSQMDGHFPHSLLWGHLVICFMNSTNFHCPLFVGGVYTHKVRKVKEAKTSLKLRLQILTRIDSLNKCTIQLKTNQAYCNAIIMPT